MQPPSTASPAPPTDTSSASSPSPRPAGLLRRLYAWVLSWADSPHGTTALAVISFAESSFFPIPPDVLQIALSVGQPRRSFRFAAISTVASILGAVVGWAIGWGLWQSVQGVFGRPARDLLDRYLELLTLLLGALIVAGFFALRFLGGSH